MWDVNFSRLALKQSKSLPTKVRKSLAVLMKSLQLKGPVVGDWPNYGKIGNNRHHCHIKKGKPTYVAVWEVVNKEIKLIEVLYVGTHEKAPY